MESTRIDLTVMDRKAPHAPWTSATWTTGDILQIPGVGIQMPMVDLYTDASSSEAEDSTA